jgi:hypothetical protein
MDPTTIFSCAAAKHPISPTTTKKLKASFKPCILNTSVLGKYNNTAFRKIQQYCMVVKYKHSANGWCTRNCVRRKHGSLPEGKPFRKEGKLPCKRKLVTRW